MSLDSQSLPHLAPSEQATRVNDRCKTMRLRGQATGCCWLLRPTQRPSRAKERAKNELGGGPSEQCLFPTSDTVSSFPRRMKLCGLSLILSPAERSDAVSSFLRLFFPPWKEVTREAWKEVTWKEVTRKEATPLLSVSSFGLWPNRRTLFSSSLLLAADYRLKMDLNHH